MLEFKNQNIEFKQEYVPDIRKGDIVYGYLIFVTIFLSILLVIVHRLVQIAEAILNLLHIIEDMDKQIHKLKRHKKKLPRYSGKKLK